MNVVGKVGSLISQGVYSVATPFHPFGGAVDVIVVQQQDGTFRSTPWYVRFGKFQGVLKGAEKVVRVTVNGVEADFHMCLDNSGEAYFVREVDSGKGIETNGDLKDSDGEVIQDDGNKNVEFHRLEHSVSDSGVASLWDECDTTSQKRFERAESDTRFYEFQEDQSSLEGPVNLSEFGSGRYEGLDSEHFDEAQGLDSEVVLVSVDGHILTAPVSASEQSAENVQLSTPQFHLGPCEGPDFCEGNEEFISGDDVWAADYICKLCSAAPKDSSDNFCSLNSDSTALRHHPEVCEEGGEHACQTEETQNLSNHESEFNRQSDVEDASVHIKKGDIFKSCLELSELGRHGENTDSEEIDSPLQAQISQDKPSCSLNSDSTALRHQPEVCEEGGEHACQTEETQNLSNHESEFNRQSDVEDASVHIKKGDIFKSCLELSELGRHGENTDSEEIDSPLQAQISQDKPSCTPPDVGETEDGAVGDSRNKDVLLSSSCSPNSSNKNGSPDLPVEKKVLDTDYMGSNNTSVDSDGNDPESRDEQFGTSAATEGINSSLQSPAPEDKSSKSEVVETETTSGKEIETHASMGFGLELPVEPQDAIPVEQDESSNPKDDDSIVTSTPSGHRWRLWPIPFRRVKTLEETSSNSSSEEVFVDTESSLHNSQADLTPASSGRIESPRKQFVRTNVPTNEQIASLNLKDGQNMITFSFSTRVLGTQQVDAHLYLWKWNAKIVISDVDGTITKSDVLGQFMPLVGRDWTQSGVAKLFSAIKENGYQLLFLSARAIVQAYLTRNFLLNLKQDGKGLPNGPVVISPDGLFPSLYREVIRRAPHEFKIACLQDIKKLFPSDYNPFYAGFGNRDTDELSYRKIGIPKGKRFIINPKGEVAISQCIDMRSYTSLHTLVNDMFPPTSLVEQEDYNSWNFWKVPMPDFE